MQAAAAVAPQIQDHSLERPLFLRLLQQPLDIPGRAGEIFLVVVLAAEIAVESRQVDKLHPGRFVLAKIKFPEFRLCFLVSQFYLISGEADNLGSRAAFRQDGQMDYAALGAANLAYDLLQRHIHHIHWAPAILGNRGNAVAALQQATFFRRATGDNLDDFGIGAVGDQGGADALQGEGHIDIKILFGARGHIRRMRIKELGKGAGENLHNLNRLVFPAPFVDPGILLFLAQHKRLLLIAAFLFFECGRVLGSSLRRLVLELDFFQEQGIFHSFSPPVLQFLAVFGPLLLVAIGEDILLEIEIVGLLQASEGKNRPLPQALQKALVDHKREFQIRGAGAPIPENRLITLEFLQVGGEKKGLARIEKAEIILVPLRRELRSHRQFLIMVVQEHFHYSLDNQSLT